MFRPLHEPANNIAMTIPNELYNKSAIQANQVLNRVIKALLLDCDI